MMRLRQPVRLVALLLVALCLAGVAGGRADASWLTRLVKDAGEAGTSAARKSASALDDATGAIIKLPEAARGTALAAHLADVGHWTFVNGKGERFTAATPAEMKRVAEVLATPATNDPAGRKLTLLMTPSTVLSRADTLKDLPDGASLRIAVNGESYPLSRLAKDGTLAADLRPGVSLKLTDRAALDEALVHLTRPMRRADVRVIALAPGGPGGLTRLPRIDPATREAVTDRIDPAHLVQEFDSLSGQTAVLTGRVTGDALAFRRPIGTEGTLDLAALRQAAARHDVSLVILDAAAPRQPGTRNWLWQRVAVPGLDGAVAQATLADFLSALAAKAGHLAVEVSPATGHRVTLRARPVGDGFVVAPDTVGRALAEIVSEVAGDVVFKGLEIAATSAERQRELRLRLVPFVPSDAQFAYIGLLVIGLMGLPVALSWWRRLWPPEDRADYPSAPGFFAARLVRLTLFTLLFLPLAAVPAAIAAFVLNAWRWITWPWRLLRGARGS